MKSPDELAALLAAVAGGGKAKDGPTSSAEGKDAMRRLLTKESFKDGLAARGDSVHMGRGSAGLSDDTSSRRSAMARARVRELTKKPESGSIIDKMSD